MLVGGVEIPDSFKIKYTGKGLYNDRYKLLQMRLNKTSGTLVNLQRDLESKVIQKKMLANNSGNAAIYRDKVYVREVLFNGNNERQLVIPVMENQLSTSGDYSVNDLDETFLVPDKVCYLIANEKPVISSKIVSVVKDRMPLSVEYNDKGIPQEKYQDVWRVNLVSRVLDTYTTDNDFRFVIEK